MFPIVVRRPRLGRLLVVVLATLCAGVAGARPDYDRVPDLIQTVTTDPSYKVRVSAALVLGKLKDKRAVPALKKVLASDGHYAVRATAAQSLGQIGDKGAIPALEKAQSDSHDFVRARAKSALQALTASAPPKPEPVTVAVKSGRERFYVGVGGIGDKSKRAGPDMVKRMREFVVRELESTPEVTLRLDGTGRGRKLKGFTIEGSITELKKTASRNYVEISCEVSYVVGVYPSRSIIMMTTGGATIQTPKGQFRTTQEPGLRVSALEEAVRGAHQNLLAFLKKQ
ncbi:MAG: HEAT repeat domain-containing protein [Deltaproteobacteria bacterium]|nr:HEAT repeat domain-containing protein [Deltaproteobacteria bacterium]